MTKKLGFETPKQIHLAAYFILRLRFVVEGFISFPSEGQIWKALMAEE